MIDRYSNRQKLINNSEAYSKKFEEKNVKYIVQFATPRFKYFTRNELKQVSYINHTWSVGDRLYKLAEKYLGDQNAWWVILRFNLLKNEVDIKRGDVIKIPTKVEQILKLLES